MESVLWVAVEALLWVWHGQVSSVLEGESLVEVWAVLQTSDVRADVLGVSFLLGQLGGVSSGVDGGVLILLSKLPIFVAVESDLWVWHGSRLAVVEGHSFIEVWAVRKRVDGWSPVWIVEGDSASGGQEAGNGEELHFDFKKLIDYNS